MLVSWPPTSTTSSPTPTSRLVTIVTYFTYIRLALPDFAAELQAAIKKARKLPAKPLILAYLLDLRDLLYFTIPVVSLLACCVW